MSKIVIGFKTREYKEYSWLKMMLDKFEDGSEKIKYLNEKDIKFAVFFEDEQEELKEYLNDHYYNIVFEY